MENVTISNEHKNLNEIFDYIDFMTNIKEEDYILYDEHHEFKYTPKFLEFINTLYATGLVEDYESLIDFVTMGMDDENLRCEMFSNWMKEMNRVLSRPCELRKTDIHFVKRAFLTLIRMEKIFPGSWGIDVETGTWLKLLRRVKELHDSGDIA
jgi:hypothetical protein